MLRFITSLNKDEISCELSSIEINVITANLMNKKKRIAHSSRFDSQWRTRPVISRAKIRKTNEEYK